MSLISEHFFDTELGVAGCEQRIQDNAKYLCNALLEPIRAHFALPVSVHDAYRDPTHNVRVGGKPNSFHLFAGGHSAADFHVVGLTFREVFDWIRLESHLPFDKLILESDSHGNPAVIHIQVDCTVTPPRRESFVGGTGDSKQYTLRRNQIMNNYLQLPIDAVNSVKSNVWAVVLVLVGIMLVLHGHENVGGSLVTGAFAVFRSTHEPDPKLDDSSGPKA